MIEEFRVRCFCKDRSIPKKSDIEIIEVCRQALRKGNYIPQYIGDCYSCGYSMSVGKGGRILYVGRGALAERTLSPSQYGFVSSFSTSEVEVYFQGELLPPVDILIAGSLLESSPKNVAFVSVMNSRIWNSNLLPIFDQPEITTYKQLLQSLSEYWESAKLSSKKGLIIKQIPNYVCFWGSYMEEPAINVAEYEKLVTEMEDRPVGSRINY